MTTFEFKAPATEVVEGTAYFAVEARTYEQAVHKLLEDSNEYFLEFREHGNDGVNFELAHLEEI